MMPMATIVPSKLPLVTISAPLQYPKGVIYFKLFTPSAIFEIKFKKYMIAAIPRPTPILPFLIKADMPKQMPASSICKIKYAK